MEWNEAESDLTVFGQSVAVEQFIAFLKRSDAYFGPGELPSFMFIFLTDPEMQESESRLGIYFGLNGIPVNVFVDARGKIVEHWSGFKEGEQALVVRVQRLIGRRFLK